MTPVLELIIRNVAGEPWEALATARFRNELSPLVPLRERLTHKQSEEVRWYIEEFMDLPEGGNVVRARKVEQELVTYGRQLWDGLQGGLVTRWLEAVRVAGEGRLELKADTPTDEVAFRSPWELLRVGDNDSNSVLLHELGVSIVRRADPKSSALEPLDTSAGLRVLAVICRPTDAGFLDPRYTPEAILSALESRPEVTVDFCRPGTFDALRDALEQARDEERPYHVVHFDGHGNHGVLLFEDQNGNKDEVDAADLGAELAAFQVPLVVLEACRTAAKASAQDTVAGALLRAGIGTVIGMGHAVHVDLTRGFTSAFYERIACGGSLGQAMQAARRQVYSKRQRRTRIAPEAPSVELHDWFVPQMYQGDADPVLLPESRRYVPRDERRASPAFRGFPREPQAGFQGRGNELHRLEREMLRHRVVVIYAPGGMGKTSLARETAHWWIRTGMFFDGAVFVSLEGNPSPDRVVSLVGEALEGFEFHKRQNGEEWLAEQLSQRQMLIVWDNFESVLPAFNAGQPMPPEFASLAERWTQGRSRLLITSRDSEVGLSARPFSLGELTKPEGLLLIISYLDRMGCDRAAREQRGWTVADLEPIVTRTGGHPLALELLAPYIPFLGPQEVATELSTLLSQAEQDSPEGRNLNMWASLEFSIRHLSEQARAALASVALLSGGCPELLAKDVVVGEPDIWRTIQKELVRTGLARIQGQLFYPHPVLADFAGLTAIHESPSLPTSANGLAARLLPTDVEERFLKAVVAFAVEFGAAVRSPDARLALSVMDVTEMVMRRAFVIAVMSRRFEHAWSIANSLSDYLQLRGRSRERTAILAQLRDHLTEGEGELPMLVAKVVRESAWANASTNPTGALDDLEWLVGQLKSVKSWDTRQQRALVFQCIGMVRYNIQGLLGEALPSLQSAERLFEELERTGQIDSANRTATLGDITNVNRRLGLFDEALLAAETALSLSSDRNHQLEVARIQVQIAQILKETGRYSEASERFEEAVYAANESGDKEVEAIAWQWLGILALEQNRLDEADQPLRSAYAAFQQSGHVRGEIEVLNSLCNLESARGNLEAAVAWSECAIGLAEKTDNESGRAMGHTNHAILLSKCARATVDAERRRRLMDQAVAEGREALIIEKRLGQPAEIARSHHNLANHLRFVAKWHEAEEHAQQALAIRLQLDSPEIWTTYGILERIAEGQGDVSLATDYRRLREAAHADAQNRAIG